MFFQPPGILLPATNYLGVSRVRAITLPRMAAWQF
jgi:hypothetical protein